jgi:hypothetical protein
MKAVNRPGSLYFSAAALFASHAERSACGLSIGGFGSDSVLMIAQTVLKATSPPWRMPSNHRRPFSVARIAGSPFMSCGIRPNISEWSETTRKSSGRDSLARWPVDVVTSSPRANRYASSGPSLQPAAPASTEMAVCRWVSPHSTRVGKSRPAYGE